MRNKNIPFFILKSLEEINKKEIIHKQYKKEKYTINIIKLAAYLLLKNSYMQNLIKK